MITKMTKLIKLSFIFFSILIFLIGCSPETSTITDPTKTIDATPQSASTATPISDLPKESQVTATPTMLSETVTPILPSETPIPTDTDEPELLRTVLPLPTIPPDEVESFVLELIRGNEDCRLPCWWGATPGETTWQETEPFLTTFSEISSAPIDGEIAYFVQIFIPDKENPSIVYGGTYQVRDDIIVSIQTGGGDQSPDFFPSQLLNKYGEPDEVWLNTYSRTLMGVLPFRLTLVYKSGFVITYSVQNATVQADSVVGCFDQTAPHIWLVSPDRNITFEESIQDWSSQIDADQTHLPLQEATDLTVPEFYEYFKNPENTACLETPTNLWP